MSGEVPKGIVESALRAQAHAGSDRHTAWIGHGRGKVTVDTQRRLESEKTIINEVDTTLIAQRLEQLGIRRVLDKKLSIDDAQYVRVVGKRARIVRFLDAHGAAVELAYEDTPQKVFRASILSENVSVDRDE